jgi:hypothetical protein
LHPDKTRLIEFGRFAAENRQRRGAGKPESFNFLGFTHLCARSRDDVRFLVRRQSMSKRLRAKLQEIKQKTKAENLSNQAAEELLRQQSKLHKDLDKFDEALKRIPGAEAPLQKAKASAYEATASLFAAKQPEAVKEQDMVLANLTTITEQLKKAANQDNRAKSADELARLSEHLKKARAALKESEPHQRKAFTKDPANAKTVTENLEEIGKKLTKARSEPELPSQVASRLEEAKEAVK